jgi:lipid-A-disaccharide synthase
LKVAIVAGESSGDLLGAALVRALQARWPEAVFGGIAGPKMQAEGVASLYPMDTLAVRGYVEVLRSLRDILAIRRGLVRELLADPPDLYIGVDAPDFNFGVESRLKAAGVPTIHYVSPSIWAWRSERIHKIGRATGHVLCLFPFEPEIYARAGIRATFVGHPLADSMPLVPDREGARSQLRLAGVRPAVALLPGSRMSELQMHADLFIETAQALSAARPELRFLVPFVTRETRDYFEERLYVKNARELPLEMLFGHSHLALHAAEAAIVASGTATLEAALARCPMVITYKLSPLTYRMVMRRALLPYFGLPNILAGEFIVPELLQDDATPANLAQALGNWLDHKAAREQVRLRFQAMHQSLARDHDARVAEALAPYFDRSHATPPPVSDGRAAPLRR